MILITFSGLDGAGKSTHAAHTRQYLERRGLRVCEVITLRYSMAGIYARIREQFMLRKRRFDASEPHPSPRPVRIRQYANHRTFDADRRNPLVRLRRLLIYPLDCLILNVRLRIFALRGYDAIICDRYVYDKIVSLPHPNGFIANMLRRLLPRPDRAFVLLVDPDEAARRKPEHLPDYFVTKAADYAMLARADAGLTPIDSDNVTASQRRIEHELEACIANRRRTDSPTLEAIS